MKAPHAAGSILASFTWARSLLGLVAGVCSFGGPKLLAASLPAAAREGIGYVKRSWQWEAGLPDNSVVSVAQTPDGFLWITTLGGLVRFDGLGVQRFSLSNLPLAGSRGVRAQHVDRHGRWWLVFDETVVAFDNAETYRVFGLEEAPPSRNLTGLAEDHSGGIWLGYRDKLDVNLPLIRNREVGMAEVAICARLARFSCFYSGRI